MLMLTREKDESFVIQVGDDVIRVQVTRIGMGNTSGKREVQLGIDAPRKYKVWRTEIYDAMQENKKAATSISIPSEKLRALLGSQE